MLTEHSKPDVTGGTIYAYTGETTGGKKLPIASLLDNQFARVDANAPKLLDFYGAASSFTRVYEGMHQNQSIKVQIGGKLENGIDKCKRIKPESGNITTENTYYECP